MRISIESFAIPWGYLQSMSMGVHDILAKYLLRVTVWFRFIILYTETLGTSWEDVVPTFIFITVDGDINILYTDLNYFCIVSLILL